ncbi:ATPase [Pelistega indica]|uniref:ATPase n=1 Tax=Pelistega indica TaxID=1414851 RepID=V8G949_9BURK|nr:cell division protein ZapE [Pelistega indica]ETD72237.1 ATPase [Pelistega indica]
MNVIQYYQKTLADKGYKADKAQQAAIERLQKFYDDWVNLPTPSEPSFFKKIFSKPEPIVAPRGVYMWGGVGRGKSFLMDSFYETVPIKCKTRIHFHEFMRSVHAHLQAISKESDPLDIVAKQISEKYQLICFDEFHVSDIADAMILYRLLQKLFDNGTSFVMTSNYEPSTLYPDGLHRDRILPAIALIKEKMDIINVDTGVDYRRRTLEQLKLYFTPITPETNQELQEEFDCLTSHRHETKSIIVEHREIPVIAEGNGVVWFSFEILCGTARSQNDYLEIANRYHTLILSDVPKLEAKDASEARRFTWLIDVLYDHKVKLIMSAQTSPEQIYVQGVQASEFHRTVSRMVEMQSKEYMEAETRHSVKL